MAEVQIAERQLTIQKDDSGKYWLTETRGGEASVIQVSVEEIKAMYELINE